MGVTSEVAQFVTGARWEDLPDAVVGIALDHVLDTLGVALAGSVTPAATIARRVFGARAGRAHVVGSARLVAPDAAAFANGVAGHALDYDDTQLSTSADAVYGLLTHPSVPALAAAAAVTEQMGGSGRDLLVAYVVGVEVECRVADAIAARHYQAGFHTTGTVGAIGATAAAAKACALPPQAVTHALGIGASMAAGLRENFGTMTKPLHAGRAAQSGVLAALLAREGFTASGDVLEAPRGFFHAAGGGFDASKIAGRLGRPFFLESPGVSIKPYPSGSLSHPAQDLILDVVAEANLTPGEVVAVTVGTNSNVPNALLYQRPATGLEAKFSLPHCIAVGVVRRRAGLAEFSDAAVADPAVAAFLPKVQVVVDPRLEQLGYQHVRTRVRVVCADGRVIEREAEAARGYPGHPLRPGALDEKFLECAAEALPRDQARAALRAIRTLPTAKDAARVLELVGRPRPLRRAMAAAPASPRVPRRSRL